MGARPGGESREGAARHDRSQRHGRIGRAHHDGARLLTDSRDRRRPLDRHRQRRLFIFGDREESGHRARTGRGDHAAGAARGGARLGAAAGRPRDRDLRQRASRRGSDQRVLHDPLGSASPRQQLARKPVVLGPAGVRDRLALRDGDREPFAQDPGANHAPPLVAGFPRHAHVEAGTPLGLRIEPVLRHQCLPAGLSRRARPPRS